MNILFEYILKKDTKTRGRAYTLSHKLSDKKLISILTGDDSDSIKTRALIGLLKDKFLGEVTRHIPDKNIEDYFQEVEDEYLKCFINDKPKKNQYW